MGVPSLLAAPISAPLLGAWTGDQRLGAGILPRGRGGGAKCACTAPLAFSPSRGSINAGTCLGLRHRPLCLRTAFSYARSSKHPAQVLRRLRLS